MTESRADEARRRLAKLFPEAMELVREAFAPDEFGAQTSITKRLAKIEERIARIEQFIGVEEFDAGGRDNLHRRVDWLEDRVRDRGDY